MRVIILAAGRSFNLDGINKILMVDPKTTKCLMDSFLDIFSDYDISVVVGFKAIEVIQRYPNLNYIYNPDWAVTRNAYSLGLALDDTPSYVISGDLLIDKNTVKKLERFEGNCVLTELTANRRLTSLNCNIKNNEIIEIYQGPLRDICHPEAHGFFKIIDTNMLRSWKKSCLSHSNLFAGQTLPITFGKLYAVDKEDTRLDEVDSVLDYIRLTRKWR